MAAGGAADMLPRVLRCAREVRTEKGSAVGKGGAVARAWGSAS